MKGNIQGDRINDVQSRDQVCRGVIVEILRLIKSVRTDGCCGGQVGIYCCLRFCTSCIGSTQRSQKPATNKIRTIV